MGYVDVEVSGLISYRILSSYTSYVSIHTCIDLDDEMVFTKSHQLLALVIHEFPYYTRLQYYFVDEGIRIKPNIHNISKSLSNTKVFVHQKARDKLVAHELLYIYSELHQIR